ncbi:MAG: putative DNA binding domain-containing protein [Endomicrobium sp.]|jgi:predicted HTH transcriptional regulator|nr:putative DNA binding domain-containing protein [Endomicrobium sp.]
MTNIKEIIKLPEGRRLEFKEKLPAHADIAKTVIAFANDAGGDLYIGIKNNPRQIIGIDEDSLIKTEEQIANIIYNLCCPIILPSISFLSVEDKHIIKVSIYPGNTPPYYLREKGKDKGSYIRVGSSNRAADLDILRALERKQHAISYDGELISWVNLENLNIASFKELFKEKTGEDVYNQTLKKLELARKQSGKLYPSRALVLLSDDSQLQNELFPYAKIECARFKGTTSEEFIDQKTITGNIALQAQQAYNFVLRHINKSASVEGIYTVSNWEYPLNAIREVIRNAITHRDYSLTGKDIKIAIYDDMIEITSPGLLPPSIDYSQMESRQSDARNKIIAVTFKKLGLIDQWGNGLKLIADELKLYPNIKFNWREAGLSFQVQFIKTAAQPQKKLLLPAQKTAQKTAQKIITAIEDNPHITRQELSVKVNMSADTIKRILAKMKQNNILRRIGPDKGGHWKIVSKKRF